MQEAQGIQPKYAQKTLDAIQLVNAGLEPIQALQAVNFKKDISRHTVHKFKKKYQRYTLTSPKIAKLAHNAVESILSGKGIEKKDENGNIISEVAIPTATNVLTAAAMYYDRAEPVVHQNLNVNATISPVDLSKYTNPDDKCAIDVDSKCVTSE